MFYTIYKTTCKVNGKIYIGKHKTKRLNDGYMGSGKYLRNAIEKYGRDNFVTEILHVFDTEEEMNNKERELVTEEFCLREDTYNLCEGGRGGWSYLNRTGLNNKGKNMQEMMAKLHERMRGVVLPHMAINLKKAHEKGLIRYDTFRGKRHTDDTKRKMSEKAKERVGVKNSQYGTFWITNGTTNRKHRGPIPEGWERGRIMKEDVNGSVR